jgi:hypothetical protein
MAQSFDGYYKWLGIPPEEQPPDHYRLLGIQLFEADHDVIESAADQRMAHVRGYQTGRHTELSQRILNEVAAARVCLLNPSKRAAYNDQLKQAMAAKSLTVLPSASSLLSTPDTTFPIVDEVPSPRVKRLRATRHKRQSTPVGLILRITGALVAVFLAMVLWKVVSSEAPPPATPPRVKSTSPQAKPDNKALPPAPPKPPQPPKKTPASKPAA